MRNPHRFLGVLLSILLAPTPLARGQDALEFDFETDAPGSVPEGWFAPSTRPGESAAVVTEESAAEGRRCVRIEKKGQQGFANLMRSFDATPYRGKRVRFRASVRTKRRATVSRAQLWLRVDREGGRTGSFDNMSDRPIRSADWNEYEILADVQDDAVAINIGLMVLGPAVAWLDAVSVSAIGAAGEGSEPAAPVSERGLENLVAFARLFGYVRHFHPSDEALDTDWTRFALVGVHIAEAATDADDLADRLQTLFRPLAPSVRIVSHRGDGEPRFPDDGLEDLRARAEGLTFWEHLGFGQDQQANPQMMSIYRSARQRREVDAREEGMTAFADPVLTRRVASEIWCRVPICLYYDGEGTLPRADAEPAAQLDWSPPDAWYPSANDRGTRLAAVIIAWNVFQHFYPYFDVAETDWEAVLPQTLRRAAEDPDGDAFTGTLRRMVAALHDGHGRVTGAGDGGHRLPLEVAWVDADLVVTHVHPGGPRTIEPGDVVVDLDGKTPQERWNELQQVISGATEGWKRYRAAQEILRCPETDAVIVELKKPDGRGSSVRLEPSTTGSHRGEPRPEKITELEPGIWYVDMDRVNDDEFNAALGDLAAARGIVFDLRGYPSSLSTVIISHLIDEPVTCAQWHVPRVRYPDREKMRYNFSDWQVLPAEPRFTALVAFVTDGRAISYAETYLGIIEHYRLAEIVGAVTAGTNGNVNPLRLPGGQVISWTGMKVLKHDGSPHHGVGILPTVPARRTIEGIARGRDELLERAVEVVSR